jgi:hypothetical protein
MEAGKRDKGEIGGVQHQLERHENNDDIPAQEHAGEPDREKHPADNEIMAERYHVMENDEARMSKE